MCVGSVIKMMYKLNFFQMDEAKRERDHLRAAMANTEDDSDRKKKQQKWRKNDVYIICISTVEAKVLVRHRASRKADTDDDLKLLTKAGGIQQRMAATAEDRVVQPPD